MKKAVSIAYNLSSLGIQFYILYPLFDNGTVHNHFAKLSQHREIQNNQIIN